MLPENVSEKNTSPLDNKERLKTKKDTAREDVKFLRKNGIINVSLAIKLRGMIRRSDEAKIKNTQEIIDNYGLIYKYSITLTYPSDIGFNPTKKARWTGLLRAPKEYMDKLKESVKKDLSKLPEAMKIIKAFQYLEENIDIFIETQVLKRYDFEEIPIQIYKNPDSIIRVKEELMRKVEEAKKNQKQKDNQSAELALEELNEIA